MIAMRHERRPHLDQQRLQFRIAGARNQRLIECIDHLLVIRVLVIDIGAIECRTSQCFQMSEVLVTI